MVYSFLRTLLLFLLMKGGFTPHVQVHTATIAVKQKGITFQIIFNQGNYEVYLRPSSTPVAPNLTLTAQVTVKVPHAVGANRFLLGTVKSDVAGTIWRATSRFDAPREDPTSDYISFELSFPTGDSGAF